MKDERRRDHWCRRIAAGALALFAAGAAHAQAYPERAIRLVVPFSPGSGTDLLARALAVALQEDGLTIIVDNKPGGEGFIGVRAVANAQPDGYTALVAGSSTQVVNTGFFKDLPYDPIKDFVGVSPLAITEMLLTTNSNLPVTSVQQFIDLATKEPGRRTFASGSATTRLAGEFFQQQANVKMVHVPYRSPALAVNDLLGEHVDMLFIDLPTVAGQLRTNHLRALAVSGKGRMRALPDVPSLQELGLKDFDLTAWYGVWLPAATPKPVVARLQALVAKAIRRPGFQGFVQSASMEPMTMTPEEFHDFHVAEIAKVGRVMKAAGIEPQ